MKQRGLFITGTDTGVGKTTVAAMIARHLRAEGRRAGAYKPVCTGGTLGSDGRLVWADVDALCEAIGRAFPAERICPQTFAAPLAPPFAAAAEHRQVDRQLLRTGAAWWYGQVDVLLVEGVGGLLCPLTDDETVADLARDLNLPVLIVARLGLGTINHTLLTVEAAERRGLEVAGIVLNEAEPGTDDPSTRINPAAIAARCHTPVLGVVAHGRHGPDQNPNAPAEGGLRLDWFTLFRN
jgi:dethiobiotin synthetase